MPLKPVLLKGSAITARERWLRERHGPAGEAQVRAALEPKHRAILEAGVLRSSWVPFALFIDMNVAIDRIFGRGDFTLCKEVAYYGAKQNLSTLYRVFFRVGSIGFVLKRAGRMWDVHYSTGRLSVTNGEGWARLIIEDFPQPHPVLWQSVAGWGEASAHLSGVTDAVATIEHSPEGDDDSPAQIRIDWEE